MYSLSLIYVLSAQFKYIFPALYINQALLLSKSFFKRSIYPCYPWRPWSELGIILAWHDFSLFRPSHRQGSHSRNLVHKSSIQQYSCIYTDIRPKSTYTRGNSSCNLFDMFGPWIILKTLQSRRLLQGLIKQREIEFSLRYFDWPIPVFIMFIEIFIDIFIVISVNSWYLLLRFTRVQFSCMRFMLVGLSKNYSIAWPHRF